MRCPHCDTEVMAHWQTLYSHTDARGSKLAGAGSDGVPNAIKRAMPNGETWDFVIDVSWMECPANDCRRPIVAVFTYYENPDGPDEDDHDVDDGSDSWIAFPQSGSNRTAPAEVEESMRRAYGEAAAILDLSPMASAALSRRILGDLLEAHGYAGFQLSKRLEAFAADLKTPHELSEGARYLVQIGDFATHTQKDTVTGEVVDVEPGEAEWCLDMIDELFDFFIVSPARMEAKKRDFDAKLSRTGRKAIR